METIIFRIKNARKLKGESIRQSAKGLGLKNHQELARIERGEKEIDDTMLHKLAKYFNVSIGYLMKKETKIVMKDEDIHWNTSQKF